MNTETPIGFDHIKDMIDQGKTIGDLQRIEIECGGNQSE